MPTFWKRTAADHEPANNTMVVHTPEEAVLATRDGEDWLAVAYTETAAAVLARGRGGLPWVQIPAPVKPPKRKAGS